MTNSPAILYTLIFVAVLLLVELALRLFLNSRRSKSDVKNRLAALKLKQDADVAYSELLLRRGTGRMSDTDSIGNVLRRQFAQSGLEMTVPRRLLYLMLFFVIGFIISYTVLNLNGLMNLAVGALFSLVLAAILVNRLRAARIRKFTSQLSPGIDIIVRSLNAGHPLNAAIALLAREMPDPIGSEFGILRDQMTFGASLDQAMMNMVDRVGAPELNLLAVTVSVQRGTGGNLSEILENLSAMIRDRLIIRAKVRAISAEGRITAWIMMLFPFFLFFMIRTMVPTYFDEVWASDFGDILVVGCLVFMFLGMLVVRKLVNFDF